MLKFASFGRKNARSTPRMTKRGLINTATLLLIISYLHGFIKHTLFKNACARVFRCRFRVLYVLLIQFRLIIYYINIKISYALNRLICILQS